MILSYLIIVILSLISIWIIISLSNVLFDTDYKLSFLFAWYDIWIGFFWDSKKKWLYILPIPFLGVILKFRNPIKPGTRVEAIRPTSGKTVIGFIRKGSNETSSYVVPDVEEDKENYGDGFWVNNSQIKKLK